MTKLRTFGYTVGLLLGDIIVFACQGFGAVLGIWLACSLLGWPL